TALAELRAHLEAVELVSFLGEAPVGESPSLTVRAGEDVVLRAFGACAADGTVVVTSRIGHGCVADATLAPLRAWAAAPFALAARAPFALAPGRVAAITIVLEGLQQ